MSKFEFRDRSVELDIAGHKYIIQADSQTGDRMKQFEADARKMMEGKISSAEALQLCKTIICEMLGNKALEEIFEDRPIKLDDCADIIVYITGEVQRFRERTYGNREQRRAAPRKTADHLSKV